MVSLAPMARLEMVQGKLLQLVLLTLVIVRLVGRSVTTTFVAVFVDEGELVTTMV